MVETQSFATSNPCPLLHPLLYFLSPFEILSQLIVIISVKKFQSPGYIALSSVKFHVPLHFLCQPFEIICCNVRFFIMFLPKTGTVFKMYDAEDILWNARRLRNCETILEASLENHCFNNCGVLFENCL